MDGANLGDEKLDCLTHVAGLPNADSVDGKRNCMSICIGCTSWYTHRKPQSNICRGDSMSCSVPQEVHLLGHQQLVQFSTTFFILHRFHHTFSLLCSKLSRSATSHAEPLTAVCQSAPYLPPRNKRACLIQKTSCSQPFERCFSCLLHETICVSWLRRVATKPEPRVRPESTDRAFQAEFSFCSKRAPLLVAT